MAEEIWTLRVFKHDRGPKGEADVVVKTVAREEMTHAKLMDIMQEESYGLTDDMFYAGCESYTAGSLTKIEGETHVRDIVKEYGATKKVDLHMFDTHVTFNDVEIVEDEADDHRCGPSDDDVHSDEEEADFIEELNEMTRRRKDPRYHDERDTDVEEIYEGLIKQQAMEEEAAQMEELGNGGKGKGKQKCRKKVVRKAKVKAMNTFDRTLDLVGDEELSDPPSDGGGRSAVEEDTDPENLPPPGKKRRSRAVNVRRVYFDEKNMMDTSQLVTGMCFSDAAQFRKAMQTWHIMQGRDYAYKKNNSDRIKVKCKQKGVECPECPFHMLASQVGSEKTIMLREFTLHNCPATRGSSRINSTWLSQQYEENFRSDPDWKIKPFVDQCLRDLGSNISKSMAYRAKRKAGEKVLGNHEHQYSRVRDYLQTINDKDPGSFAVVTTDDRFDQGLPPLFNGLFICLNAQRKGFMDGCRPFISIDGCFVKLSNGAQILAASARDGNNNMFPIAFAVVGAEDTVSWTWFLETLRSAVGSGDQHGGWTIMSDRQKGLLNAVAAVFPNCEHRFCKRHLLLNMALKGFRGEKYKKYVDDACYATTEWDYNTAMQALKEFNERAWKWLNDIGKQHFSRHAFSSKAKTDLVVNNLSEVFNKWVLEARDKPIVTMCEFIRRSVMTRCAGKREGVSKAKWEITPVVAGRLELEKRDSRYCHAYRSGFHLFEVHCSDRSYGVNLEARTCECNRWQLTGIPCKHACSALYEKKELPENYVHEYFKKASYIRTYAHIVFPLVGEHGWTRTNTPDIDPPKFRKQAGRPKTKRRKGVDEGPKVTGRPRMTTVTCSNCGCHKHTFRTCGIKLKPDLQLRLDTLQSGGKGRGRGAVAQEAPPGSQEQLNSQENGDAHAVGASSGGIGAQEPPASSSVGRARGGLAYWLGM